MKIKMAQEDQKCSNNSSGTCGVGGGGNILRSSKKQKPKKVPQRGLGVAQLERIRLEEQQKKDAAMASPFTTISPTKSSVLSLSTPNFHPSNQSSSPSAIPFLADISSANLGFRPSSSSTQNIETLNSNNVPLTNPVGLSTVSLQGHENVHKLWESYEFNLEKESSGVNPGSTFCSTLNHLSHESIPMWPVPSLMERAQQFQHHPSLVVNESSATSSSSVLNFQMEPPSNQSYYGNYIPMWTEEEKMVGMKRSYPFPLDNPPGISSFHCKFPPILQPRISQSDDSASCGSGGHTLNFEPVGTLSRGGSSCSTFMLEPNHSKKSIKENGLFLTLAPPTTISMSQGSKLRHSQPYLAFHSSEFSDFESLPYQGNVEDPILWPELSRPSHQQPYYSFFPQAVAQKDQAIGRVNNCNNGEVGGSVDLNLKL
ncbi:uncharacterized protein LOC123206143 [Mangifera indica]|uniref:uncharacterized protein LOC123206143 n=1 Tax=Mangifera indica TaxID=29780 RepID=UPI001CFB86CD|nr:uncharacterized protein LOC123206143 [Mangifera indica]XP_044479208.1 uncharacterized protein LOC123206143 [Mangifera indica]XP_044479209.1 uncharacterized protein LOC123206143 [Mangifera indica]